MRFFNSKTKNVDRVWSTTDQKMEDILRNIAISKSNGRVAICIYHFLDAEKHLSKYFSNRNIIFHKLRALSELDSVTPEKWLQTTDAVIFNSDLISQADIGGKRGFISNTKIKFELHIIEHYPIPTRDEKVLSYAASRSDISGLTSYVALTEPWISKIMGARVIELLDKMGLNENEVIEHPLVSSSLRKAQIEIAKRMRRDFPYDSVEEWLKGNLLD